MERPICSFIREENEMDYGIQLVWLTKLIQSGWNIRVGQRAKIIEGNWCNRFIWVATNETTKKECDWDGFETAEECINDLISKIK